MEKERRNNLRRVIHECRKLLEDEISRRLAYYGIMSDGSFLDLAKLPHLTSEDWKTRQRIEQAIEKEALGKLTKVEAVQRYIHHVGFTYLNRFAALRAMEVRGLIKETIIRRDKYEGRSLRERDVIDSNPHLTPEQVLKESLIQAFQEVGEEIKVLFDMNNEYSLVFPGTRTCLELIRLLTKEVTEEDWRQDDVIGWIYQYFNSQAREEYRKARRKPRPDDIPVINQFYTPDWIVKALVDNTLGRLWLEMHPGSKIKDFCTYFVPLKEMPPEREAKRIRDIKVLDPACGSGHFLVYAFDLLYQMYSEDEPETPPSEIPALVLENNLFGIDIDLRSVQLAALCLYLKAKTYSPSLKVRGMNLVCADVRIADSERRLEFLKRFEDDPALQHIFARLFEELEYTYEIGSLLKVRVPFERLFRERMSAEGVQARLGLPLTGQAKLGSKGLAGQTKFAFSSSQESTEGSLTLIIPKERTMEEMLDELRSFEHESIDAQDMGRLLFATEAEKSVGLLSLLSQKYDVVLMNPPYGEMPPTTREYLRKYYPNTYYDYYTAFIEQATHLCELNGFSGMLTGRTFMFLKLFEKVRTKILLENARPEILFDLNSTPADSILDEATGRWAATVARRTSGEKRDKKCIFVRLTLFQGEKSKIKALKEALSSWLERGEHEILYPFPVDKLKTLPLMPYFYWIPETLTALFYKYPPLDRDYIGRSKEQKIADLKTGLTIRAEDQFRRYWWEVPVNEIAVSREETKKGKKWVPFAKGGDAYYSDVLYVVNWGNDGEEIKDFPKSSVTNEEFYFKPGLCWSDIVSSELIDVRPLPEGVIFSESAHGLFTESNMKNHLMGLINSSLSALLFLALDPTMHHRKLWAMAWLPISPKLFSAPRIKDLCAQIHTLKYEWDTGNEISTQFVKPWLLQVLQGAEDDDPSTGHPLANKFQWSESECAVKLRSIRGSYETSIRKLTEICVEREKVFKNRLRKLQESIDEEVYALYGVDENDRRVIEEELRTLRGFSELQKEKCKEDVELEITVEEHVCRLLSFYVKRVIEEDPNGIVPLDDVFPNNLTDKIRQLISEDFGKDQVDQIEQELHQLLGIALTDWLAQRFFDFHVSLYKNRPIFWQFASYEHGHSRSPPPGVFSCFVHYHRLTRDTLPKIWAFYLDRIKEILARQREHLLRKLEPARAKSDKQLLNRLSKVYEDTLGKIEELERFEETLITIHNPRKDKKVLPKSAEWVDRAIAEVRDDGWSPIIDHGVRVNIEPLKEARLLHPAADRVK